MLWLGPPWLSLVLRPTLPLTSASTSHPFHARAARVSQICLQASEDDAKAKWLAKQEASVPWSAKGDGGGGGSGSASTRGVANGQSADDGQRASSSSGLQQETISADLGWVHQGSPPPVAPAGAFQSGFGFSTPSRRNDYEAYIATEYGAESPAPGREAEYEAYQKMMSQYPQQATAGGGGGNSRPTIDEERRSRSPGLSNNFYEISTSDFRTPYGMPKGSASPMPELEEPQMPQMEFGAESPAPGREAEFAAYQAQYGGQGAAQGGGGYSPPPPPPIDEERRSRSPGLAKNFYDIPMSDFKTPYGMPAGSGAPAPMEEEPQMPQVEFGAESPAPGREAEYAAWKAQNGGQGAAQGGGGYSPPPPPPIDEERRSRSPGLAKNFYDIPMSDFKTPYGMPAGSGAPAPMEEEPQMPQVEFGAQSAAPGREAEYEAYNRRPNSPPPLGDGSPIAGREQEQASAPMKGGLPYAPPPIDTERRNRSPGLQHNFYDVSTADFKTPYGIPPSTAPPAAPEPPEGEFGAQSPWVPEREKEHAALQSGGERPSKQPRRGGGDSASKSSTGADEDDEDEDEVNEAEAAAAEALAEALRASLLEAEACARSLADLSFDLAEELQDTALACADRPGESVAVLREAAQTLVEMNEALAAAHTSVKEADANVTATLARDKEVQKAVANAKAAAKQREVAKDSVHEATKSVDKIPDLELFPKSARSHMETALKECKEQLVMAEKELAAANDEVEKRDRELRELAERIRAGL